MKTIDFAPPPPDVARLLDQARDDDLIVRLPDGSEFLLVAIDVFDQEIVRTRSNPRLMALLDARGKRRPPSPWMKSSGGWEWSRLHAHPFHLIDRQESGTDRKAVQVRYRQNGP